MRCTHFHFISPHSKTIIMKNVSLKTALVHLLAPKYALAIVFSGIISASIPALAQQHTTTYYMPNNVKHYSTEIATDPISGDPHETVMAGTIFGFTLPRKNVIHFINVSYDGTVNSSKYIDIPGYNDERVVDIESDKAVGGPGSAIYFLTCLARDARGNDEIVIISTDVYGNLINTRRLADGAQSMYPLHSVFSGGYLYICGYTTKSYTNLPSTPDYGPYYDSTWGAFIQVNPYAGTVTYSCRIDTDIPAGAIPNAKNDYDLAMRLVPMANGKIFVTGSVNDAKFVAGNWRYGSAIMNLVWDPNTSIWTNINHFSKGAGALEYGTGMVEDGGVNYILGNTFYHGYSGNGFAPLPAMINITGVDNNMAISTTVGNTSRYQLNGSEYGMWGLQTLDQAQPAAPGYKRFVIAGLQMFEFCNFYHQPDVDPFLYDVEVSYDGTSALTHTFNKWVTYQNLTKTGGSNPSGYFNLGGGLSNIAWNPTFAARPTPNDDIILNAPKWYPYTAIPVGGPTGVLNLKSVRADANSLTGTLCSDSYHEYFDYGDCFNPFDYVSVEAANCTTSFSPLSITTYPLTSTGGNYDMTSYACVGNDVYKQGNTGITNLEPVNGKTILYPNPAHTSLNVVLDKSIADAANVKLLLINVYGQVAGILYEGSALRLDANNKLALPNVASGMYNVQVLVNNDVHENIKLSIQ